MDPIPTTGSNITGYAWLKPIAAIAFLKSCISGFSQKQDSPLAPAPSPNCRFWLPGPIAITQNELGIIVLAKPQPLAPQKVSTLELNTR